jgi:FtsP/CotA-like multicopper oxidase with cupredoxin domain
MLRSSAFMALLAITLLSVSASYSDHPVFQEPAGLYSENGSLHVELHVTVGRVSTGPYHFNARMWEGSCPGPTIYVKPGDYLRITIYNDLGAQNYSDDDTNEIMDLNTTNIHVHGLHVPSIADNVFIQIDPGENYTYEYYIIDDHYPGTHMNHPHHHGSSGDQFHTMHGALIVLPANEEVLDPFLRNIDFKVMQFEHFYAELTSLSDESISHSLADLELQGSSELYYDLRDKTEEYLTINNSLYNVHVNAQYQPILTIEQNEWIGLRLIGSNPIYNLELEFDSRCEVFIVARDGVYLDYAIIEEIIVLTPGTRVDVVVRCTEAGIYEVKNVASEKFDWMCAPELYYHCIDTEILVFLLEVLESDIETDSFPVDTWTAPLRPYYLQDLSQIPFSELNGTFEIMGDVNLRLNDRLFVSEFDYLFDVALHPHGVYEFNLTMDGGDGDAVAHPIHIHVNHFQIVNEIIRVEDSDYTGEASGNVTSLYRLGEFRDTVLVFSNRVLVVRFSTFGYTGTLTMHCHFLHHSDLGMMATIAVSDGFDEPAHAVGEDADFI